MRIGILGGTFDPLHYGHIRPALEVKKALNLDEIWLMPNHIPPHKQGTNVATADRLAMASQVCDRLAGFSVCEIEAARQSPSYTVTTLETLRRDHPRDEFLFLMGMDSFVSLPSWYQWQRLFDLCHIVICQRAGWELSSQLAIYPEFQQRHVGPERLGAQATGLILTVDISPQPFSSTLIRQQLARGQIDADAMPAEVKEYIQAHRLYR